MESRSDDRDRVTPRTVRGIGYHRRFLDAPKDTCMKSALHGGLVSAFVLILLLPVDTGLGQAMTPPAIPLVPGLTIVLAAHNATPPQAASMKSIAQGDYELVVSVTGVTARGIDETTSVEAEDENHKPLQLTIRRHVLATDLAGSRLQLLGFHTDDPQEIPGTTSLGPSLAVTRDLRMTGQAPYSVMNFLKQATSTGTLTRVGQGSVPFPVILNGRRTTLPAMRVAGLLKYGDKVRPWEQVHFRRPEAPAHVAVRAWRRRRGCRLHA